MCTILVGYIYPIFHPSALYLMQLYIVILNGPSPIYSLTAVNISYANIWKYNDVSVGL